MPQEVYNADLELKVSILEAGLSDGLGPFPRLSMAGREELRTFETVVLENDWLTATLVPDLGGRMLGLVDKRSGVDVLAGELVFREAGPRGVHGFGGLEITLDGEPRMNALGFVRTASSEEGVWLAEAVAGNGLSYHLHVSLEGAAVRYALTIRNRTLRPVMWNPGLLGPTFSRLGEAVVCGNLGLLVEDKRFAEPRDGRWTYFGEARQLAPRWGETINFTIVLLAGLGSPAAVTEHGALGFTEDELVLQPARTVEGAKLVLQSAAGQTMEAPADLTPGSPLRYKFAELGGKPTGFALLDSDRAELLRYPALTPALEQLPTVAVDYAVGDIASLAVEPATRYWGFHLRTREAFRNGRFEEAEQMAEHALLYNGEDPLAWIEKAAAARLAGAETDESPDLPNAHFLAPLEPLLRAEGFLVQAGLDGKTFFASLAATPNDLVEIACTYVDFGLLEDAARFIDAALTVSSLGMLRYLYAYCCVASGTLFADAAAAVGAVTSFEPPYPWRPVELEALAKLAESFPNNEVLGRYLAAFKNSKGVLERDLAR